MIDERVLGTERTVPFSAQAVFGAFASPELLAAWWGPDGFTNSFEVFEFRVNGRWIFTMHGPDGKSYPNKSFFVSLDPGQFVVIRHDCAPYFTLSVQLRQVEGGTHLTWRQEFDDSRTAQAVRSVVDSANEQNIDRLCAVLAANAGAA